jgi:hypothetical protein
MKKIIAMLVVVSIMTTSCSKHNPGTDDLLTQQSRNGGLEDNPNGGGGDNTTNIPAAVLAAFNARYANASNIQWKLLSNGNFKAEFFRGSVKWQAIFTTSGNLVKEEHD